MIYELNASNQIINSGEPMSLWDADSVGTKLRIQNQSRYPLSVLVTLPDDSVLEFILPAYGDFVDETWIDPTLAVAVQSAYQRAGFAAVRLT